MFSVTVDIRSPAFYNALKQFVYVLVNSPPHTWRAFLCPLCQKLLNFHSGRIGRFIAVRLAFDFILILKFIQ